MGGLDVINILDGLDRLLKKISWIDRLDVINILDGLDRYLLDGMDWILDGLLTTLIVEKRHLPYSLLCAVHVAPAMVSSTPLTIARSLLTSTAQFAIASRIAG